MTTFDTFLSHNSQDKPVVRQLTDALIDRGLRPWLDERQLVPGRQWQDELELIIQTTRTAVVVFGPAGLGPWEEPEMRACLNEYVTRKMPVIPVLLPGAPRKPDLPLFLRSFTWVDLRDGLTGDGLNRLQWGITGKNPDASSSSSTEKGEFRKLPEEERSNVESDAQLKAGNSYDDSLLIPSVGEMASKLDAEAGRGDDIGHSSAAFDEDSNEAAKRVCSQDGDQAKQTLKKDTPTRIEEPPSSSYSPDPSRRFWVILFLAASLGTAILSTLLILSPRQETTAPAEIPTLSPAPPKDEKSTELRIGIVAYDNVTSRAKMIQECFSAVKDDNNKEFRVTFAVGTAEEVLDWITEGSVDLAVLSPGALASTDAVLPNDQQESDSNPPAWRCKYLVTPSLLKSDNPFASDERRGPGQFVYDPLCLINKESLKDLKEKLIDANVRLEDADDPAAIVKQSAVRGWVQFVFGDPLSLSGTIYPRAMIIESELLPSPQNDTHSVSPSEWFDVMSEYSELSFGLTDTIDLLMDDIEHRVPINNNHRHRVGFVFDGAMPREPDKKSGVGERTSDWTNEIIAAMQSVLVPVQLFPKLIQDEKLPAEVWVVRPDFDDRKTGATDRLRKKLLELTIAGIKFKDQSEKLEEYGNRIKAWAAKGGIELGKLETKRTSSISEILDSMRHYQRVENERPRLALVLSGGGAKCAYQAGAIASIERELARLCNSKQLPPLQESGDWIEPDIALVVGSSGGALNALPVALGLTKKGQDDFLQNIWRSIHLTDFFHPNSFVKAALGAVIGLTLLFVTWLLGAPIARGAENALRKTDQLTPTLAIRRQATLILRVIFAFVILAVLFARLQHPYLPDRLLLSNRYYFYLIWIPFHLSDVWILVVLVLGIFLNSRGSRWREATFELKVWRFFGCVLGAILFLGCTVWLQDTSLSSNDAMKRVMIEHLELIMRQEHKTEDLDIRARALSHAIEKSMRPRDLVIAVTVVGKEGAADRFLKVPSNLSNEETDITKDDTSSGMRHGPDRHVHGSELHVFHEPDQLVKLIIASGTVFPIFRSETFPDAYGRRDELKIVDGGYGHNIPIEAAVDWGATHIIVVEATPTLDRSEKTTFGQNIETAYDLLFAQAQLTDMRSRQKVEIYTLRPREEVLKILEFAPVFTKAAVEQGAKDADDGRFRQYSREPQFESNPPWFATP